MVSPTINHELAKEFSNVIIRASAGTGKTFALSNRYLRLLASGAECQTILATTFTKKGAGEILDRIIDRLSAAALDSASAQQLSIELGWSLTQQRAADVLHDLLRNLHRLEISTLDSFFNRVAKVFSLELGLPSTWEIVEEQQMQRLYDQAIQAVLQDTSVLGLLHMLSKGEAARRVATMIQDTVEHVYRVYRESGPEPWDRLPITGKFLSTDELDLLLARIENLELPGKALPKHWVEVTNIAVSGDWAAFASTTSFQNVLAGNPTYSRAKLPAEMLAIYHQLLPHCVAFVEQRLIQQNHSTRDLLMAFGALLDQAKSVTGDLRFDDVTERLQQFIGTARAEQFSFRLDHQIQHLLLDEFQDTALAQWDVIRPFAHRITETRDALRSLFCVGDMKQAIYGWRGGVAEIFDLVDSELPNLDETESLTKSYRSSQPVIDLVNQVFLNVNLYDCGDDISNGAIRGWANWFAEHTTTKSELAGYVSIEMAAERDDSTEQSELSKDDSRNENVIRATIERVKELTTNLPAEKTIGLIVRTNDEVGRLIFRLQHAGIAASEEGGNALTDSAAVELILSVLTLADHPGDSLARFHLSHSPLAQTLGLEPETDSNQKANAAKAIHAAARLRLKLVTDGYGPTVESLARVLKDRCTKRELTRLQQLVQVAYSSSANKDFWQLRPQRFAEFVRDEVKVSDQSSAQVRVMTIHKAKGLEFDVVLLPMPVINSGWAGMTPNVVVGRENPTSPIEIATRYVGEPLRKLLPENFQRLFEDERKRNVREAMCVLYVALTRAAHATHVIVAHGSKVSHKSPAGLLLATVCPEASREAGILYEHGDRNWFEQPKATDPAKDRQNTKFDFERFYLPAKVARPLPKISQEIRSGRGVPRIVPSWMEGGDRLEMKRVFETADGQSAKARGSLLHACFELVRWLDQSVPTKQQLEEHLHRRDPAIKDFSSITDSFYRSIEYKHVRDLLSLKSYQELFLMHFPSEGPILLEANRLEVETERPFAVQLDEGLLQGVIDRLVWIYEGDRLVAADIIDLKTDRVDETGIPKRVEFYRPQLSSYRSAVAKLTGLPMEKIATRLLFLQTGQLVNLELAESELSPEQARQLPKPKRTGNTASKVKQKPTLKKDRQQTLWSED